MRADDLLEALRATAAPLAEVHVTRKPGVYAWFLDHPAALPSLSNQGSDRYVGITSNLAQREFDTHFRSGQSGFSTLRRSLGALLRDELSLSARPRGAGSSDSNYRCYRFGEAGEARLTAWMHEHLRVGAHEWPEPAAIEKELIGLAQPPLNLTGWRNPHAAEIKALRKACVEEARCGHPAKGGTSSRAGSPKHGKPMSGGKVRMNIAEALYTAAVAATRARTPKEDGLVSAVAFQDDARHRKYADPLQPALDRLGIGVFWVAAGGAVMLESPWSLY